MTSFERPSESTPETGRLVTEPEPAPASIERFLEALPLEKFKDSRERREGLALIKVVRLAPTLEVAEALCRGEKVPRSSLDPTWRDAYGL